MSDSIPFRKEWGQLALRYLKYRLIKLNVTADSRESRDAAVEVENMTGISAGEVARFINALLRDNVGKTFRMERAIEVAIAWCLENKKKVVEEFQLDRDSERCFILVCAEKIGVDPVEALAFNDFLESLF